MRSNKYFSLLIILFATVGMTVTCIPSHANSDDEPIPFLERIVTINFSQERLEVVLKKLSTQAGFTFSYNSKIIDENRMVTESFKSKTVREVLDQLFGGAIQYKSRGKYVILMKAPPADDKDQQVVTGYVIDEATGKRLQNVSVYDPVSLSSTVTDSYGYFQLKVDQPSGEEVKLAIRKLNYADTVVEIQLDRRELINIQMQETADKAKTFADTVRQRIKRYFEKRGLSKQATNVENIQDTLHRKIQFSVFPFVGTNHKLSGNVINDYSFNLFGGYSMGVEKLEIGGLFNGVRGDVKGVQVAGIFNSVGGKVKAVQMAGLLNMNRDSVIGYQFSGMVNLNGNSSNKLAAAGLLNLTLHDSRGWHIAGLGNATIGKQEGPHLAGLLNFSTKDSYSAHIAGLTNVTIGNFKGVQGAALLNFSLRDLEGAQISGLLNYAHKVYGAQVGLINVTDSIRGVPIGLLNVVFKGYHQVEVSADEIFYTNVAFRTGVRQFYNIITAGAKPHTFEDEFTYWTFGYGLGTAPRLSRTLSLNVDLISNQVVYGESIEAINMINKLYVGLDVRIMKYVGIAFGVTLNGYVTDTTYDKYPPLFTDYNPNIFFDKTYSNDINMKMWLGGKIGLRFL